jgi:H+/gluconate symporter-like permease
MNNWGIIITIIICLILLILYAIIFYFWQKKREEQIKFKLEFDEKQKQKKENLEKEIEHNHLSRVQIPMLMRIDELIEAIRFGPHDHTSAQIKKVEKLLLQFNFEKKYSSILKRRYLIIYQKLMLNNRTILAIDFAKKYHL